MNEATLQIVIQAGAVGTNLVMLYVFLKVATIFNENTKQNNDRVNKLQEDHTHASVKLAESLTKLADRVSDCPSRKQFKQQLS